MRFGRLKTWALAAGRGARTVWLAAGVALALLLLIEVAGRLYQQWQVTRLEARLAESARKDSAAGSTPGPEHSLPFWEETARALKLSWEPYTCWRFEPCDGEFVNVDATGRRRTWNPPLAEGAGKPTRLFLFGGSTLWGFGARDEHTIPSELSRLLAAHPSGPIEVENFAVPGYVTEQALLVLERQLKENNVPNVVIFYGGFNDALAALVNQRAGAPLWDQYYRVGTLASFWLRSATYASGRDLACQLGLREQVANAAPRDEFDHLAEETARALTKTRSLVDHLARAYGFRAIFFWQPNVHDKPALTQREAVFAAPDARLSLGGFEYFTVGNDARDFLLLARAAARRSADAVPGSPLVDLSAAFADHSDAVFLDRCHLTERGNVLLAEQMLPHILKLLTSTASDHR